MDKLSENLSEELQNEANDKMKEDDAKKFIVFQKKI